MNFTALAGIGILLVLALIVSLLLFRRDFFRAEPNKGLYIATGALQASHIIVYLTGALEKIAQINVFLAFGICAVLSILCILMSAWMLLPFSNCKHGLRYLLLFIAILQVLGTVVIFLLPEAGIPPAVGIR